MSEIIKLADLPCHIDDRGEIQMLFERTDFKSVSRIKCLPNTFRARHKHDEFHYSEILEGQLEIYHVELDEQQRCKYKPTKHIVNKGEIILTPSGLFHEMNFSCFTVFNCFSNKPRSQNDYEAGLIRYPTISLKKIYDNWKD